MDEPQVFQVENFCFNKNYKLDWIKKNAVCIDCNFQQKGIDTLILAGITGLRIIGGNIGNAIFPPGTKIDGLDEGTAPFIGKSIFDKDGKFVRNDGKRDLKAEEKMSKQERKDAFKEFKKLPENKRNRKIVNDFKKDIDDSVELS